MATSRPIETTGRVITGLPAHLKKISAASIPDEWGLNMVIFGVPGVGKTTLAASAQDSPFGQNVLVLDVEGGARSIADREDVDIIRPTTIKDINDIHTWLRSDKTHTYRTIIIDTISELQRVAMREVLASSGNPEIPEFQHWNRVTETMSNLVRQFCLFSERFGWNVIFIAHASEKKVKVGGATMIVPKMNPASSEAVSAIVDAVGFMSIKSNGQRELRLAGTNVIQAKYRQPRTARQGTRILPPLILDPTMPMILDHLRGAKTLPPVKDVAETEEIRDEYENDGDGT